MNTSHSTSFPFVRFGAGLSLVLLLLAALLPGCTLPTQGTPANNLIQPTAAASPSRSQEATAQPAFAGLPDAPTDQIVLRFKPASDQSKAAEGELPQRVPKLSEPAGVKLAYQRTTSSGQVVVKLPQKYPVAEVLQIAAKLMSSGDVLSAEPDYIRRHTDTTPNDPRFSDQWHYRAPTAGSFGINLPAAWDLSTGSASVVVAVVDTGILFNHPDLQGRTVPGYDFISDAFMANDGGGRDADASDPGDWANAEDGCGYISGSSWHGSHVAGTIGAASNNATGVAGVNWQSKILPVRVLGKCGGYDSDIADGMRWAAGLSVAGVPANPNPAKVINLSLGGSGACTSLYQNAINEITARGTVVVVAAGNSNADAANFTPANCNGVIAVAATNQDGGKASFSNYGSKVKVSAPGVQVLSTVNDGATSPTTYSYKYYQGTSMASPHVAGLVSLLFSVNPNLTPARVLEILQRTASAFPSGSSCTTALCGAGVINAAAALREAGGTTGTPTPTIDPGTLNRRHYLPELLREPPAPTPTPVTAAPCKPGAVTSDPSGDVSAAHIDVISLASSIAGNRLQATFTLRDIPAQLTFNRIGVPIYEFEYWWGVFVDADNNLQTGDYRPYYHGADHAILLQRVATGGSPYNGSLGSETLPVVYTWDPNYMDWVMIDAGTSSVSASANTISLSGELSGLNAASRVFFLTFDYNPSGAWLWDWSNTCNVLLGERSSLPSPPPVKEKP